MSTNRMYWGAGRLGDGDRVPIDEPPARRIDPYRRCGYAAVWALTAFGVAVLAVVIAAAI